LNSLGDFNFAAIARLKPGVSQKQATDELNAIQDSLMKRFAPEPIELRAYVIPLQSQITGRSREGLLLMLGAVGAVLLIVCVNVATLLLPRPTARRREFAIRAAIGASSSRLARQMLTESLLFALIGGTIGVALAYASIGIILANAPIDLPRSNEIHVDA